ncbi:NAD-specific glutamate dehydrogenase [Phytophthora cinnamomi]|uniref:NAD-specific glutamate dehydrogenase n=1 Tax=Phytophthora cinnamomi TaxID=4785 RepID=UPI003559B403|nr:NAD-specific glutamate dehydrogenase [Phytophthora cinnamomi]
MSRAFLAQSNVDVEVYEKEILHALDKFQKDAAGIAVPSYLENMPPSYFPSVQEEDRVHPLDEITERLGPDQPGVLLRSSDHTVYSRFFSGANFPERMAHVLGQIP